MHQDEGSRQQRGRANVQANAGRTNRHSNAERPEAGASQQKMQRRELDVPATPRQGGGRTEPKQPQLDGERNEEGVGNLISRDKTLLESPERGKGATPAVRGGKLSGKNGKNKRKGAA
jgi:hypothetical protein